MGLGGWILLFAANSAFFLWVLRWGGAEWMEGWRSLFFIDWFRAPLWSAEMIKLYVLLCWIGHAIWFLLGIFMPAVRGGTG